MYISTLGFHSLFQLCFSNSMPRVPHLRGVTLMANYFWAVSGRGLFSSTSAICWREKNARTDAHPYLPHLSLDILMGRSFTTLARLVSEFMFCSAQPSPLPLSIPPPLSSSPQYPPFPRLSLPLQMGFLGSDCCCCLQIPFCCA